MPRMHKPARPFRDVEAATLTLLNKAPRRHGSPEAIATDGLCSDRAAMDALGCRDRQEAGRWANHRCENSHLPFP